MDPVANVASSAETPEDLGINRSPSRGILKKSQTIGTRKASISKAIVRRSTSNIESTRKVTFSDKNKNSPICHIIEVEPIRYDDNDSPKGKSCTCFIF